MITEVNESASTRSSRELIHVDFIAYLVVVFHGIGVNITAVFASLDSGIIHHSGVVTFDAGYMQVKVKPLAET